MSGSAVVDFEAFHVVGGEIVVKELAIVDLHHGLCRYVLFKPPYSRRCLSQKDQRTALWLEQKLHGISWSDGVVDYSRFPDIIREVCDTYCTVFTKGLEKARFLRAFHNRVIDLNDINAPKYDNTALADDRSLQCRVATHRFTDHEGKCVYKCALNKAYFFASWLRTHATEDDAVSTVLTGYIEAVMR